MALLDQWELRLHKYMGKKRNITMDENQEQQLSQSSYNKYSQRSSDPFDLPEEFAMIAAADEARRQQAKLDNGEIQEKKENVDKKTKVRTKKNRSQHYKNLKVKIDPKLKLSLKKAVELLINVSKENFDSTVELNIVSKKDSLSGTIDLPHGTGKQKRVVIFDDELLKKIEAKQIDFDVLITKPEDMSKLAKYAKILGPKGLMPNPKNGTVTKDPEKALKDLSGNKLSYKTEKKAPLIHLAIGKRSFGADKLIDNLTSIFTTLNIKSLKSATICTSMSPSIKLDLEHLAI